MIVQQLTIEQVAQFYSMVYRSSGSHKNVYPNMQYKVYVCMQTLGQVYIISGFNNTGHHLDNRFFVMGKQFCSWDICVTCNTNTLQITMIEVNLRKIHVTILPCLNSIVTQPSCAL